VVDFVPEDMEPLEVIVHPPPAAEGRLLFEPFILTPSQFMKRLCPDLL
jgi:hypothetical protein